MSEEAAKGGWLRQFALHPLTMLIVGFLGAVGTDIAKFSSETRTEQRAAVASVRAVDEELRAILKRYADIAAGERANTKSDLDDLSNALLKDQAAASRVATLIPKTEDEYKKLQASSVAVIQSARNLKDATQAPAMAEAVGRYLFWRQSLERTASDDISSYKSNLIPSWFGSGKV